MNGKIKKIELDFEKAEAYVKDHLSGGNTLSQELLKIIRFEDGSFFTLLPEDADLGRIYEFPDGWILPNQEVKEYINKDGKKCRYSDTPRTDKELCDYIFDKSLSYSNPACISEDVLKSPTDPHVDFFRQHGLLYLNKIYYFLDKKKLSKELIFDALWESETLWRLLMIIVEKNEKTTTSNELTLDEIRDFCRKTQLLIVAAYDGEGYVLWERNRS